MVLFLLVISGLSFRNLPVFAVGLVGLFLYIYPAQTIAGLTAVYFIYSLLKDKKILWISHMNFITKTRMTLTTFTMTILDSKTRLKLSIITSQTHQVCPSLKIIALSEGSQTWRGGGLYRRAGQRSPLSVTAGAVWAHWDAGHRDTRFWVWSVSWGRPAIFLDEILSHTAKPFWPVMLPKPPRWFHGLNSVGWRGAPAVFFDD